jgi:hypothetical protein
MDYGCSENILCLTVGGHGHHAALSAAFLCKIYDSKVIFIRNRDRQCRTCGCDYRAFEIASEGDEVNKATEKRDQRTCGDSIHSELSSPNCDAGRNCSEASPTSYSLISL